MPAGPSLVGQWLRIHLPMRETWVVSLVGKLRSHMPGGPQNPRATLEMPACHKEDPAQPEKEKEKKKSCTTARSDARDRMGRESRQQRMVPTWCQAHLGDNRNWRF